LRHPHAGYAISNQVSHLTLKLTWCWRNSFCHILWPFRAAERQSEYGPTRHNIGHFGGGIELLGPR